jgi:hypothetical protein
MAMKSWKKKTNIGAAADRLQGIDCGFLAFRSLQVLPHAFGGRGKRLSVKLFAAEFGDCPIKVGVLFRSKEFHDAPFKMPRRLFFSRARVRWRVTATTAWEVFIIRAISGLSSPSI